MGIMYNETLYISQKFEMVFKILMILILKLNKKYRIILFANIFNCYNLI